MGVVKGSIEGGIKGSIEVSYDCLSQTAFLRLPVPLWCLSL